MRSGGALFAEKSLWAQELGGGSLGGGFQTVKTLRKVSDKFKRMSLYGSSYLQIDVPEPIKDLQYKMEFWSSMHQFSHEE